MPKAMKWAIVFVLTFTLVVNTQVHKAAAETAIVGVDSLNIRSGPGLTYDVIGTSKRGESLTILATSDEWIQIKHGNGTGWIASWLVTMNTTASKKSSLVVSRVDRLNIRSGPSVGSSILGRMNAGDEAKMIDQNGSWTQIIINNTTGWIHSEYITEIAEQVEHVSTEQKQDTFTIAVDALNVRKNADLSSKRVGIIYKNESYEIKEINGNWVRIVFDTDKSKEGWVYSFHGSISSSATVANNKQVATNNTVTILSNGTNIRESATTSSPVATRADAGERFTIKSQAGDWFEVALPNGKSAFVAKWVVSTSEDIHTEQQTKKENSARVPGTLKGLTIVVDPGHGGNDRGSTGARGTDEKDITLLTSERLASKLKAAGANVILTRESDAYVSLRKRVAVSHQVEADAFISVHYDATTTPSVGGFTTYYMHERQKSLAMYVNDGLASSVALRNRGAQPGDFLVLRENRQNAVLIELGFISNPGEELSVTTDSFREQASLGIYNGLLNYFNSN
ncbi:SH3 domain-containing protein [Sporosarcina siberiensis]|uniref:SH3 domain-containing protein n=1 Tax=Sporosarcina siberiensis TaxID=1365606 RepID=A0ABW4SD93_9BACL